MKRCYKITYGIHEYPHKLTLKSANAAKEELKELEKMYGVHAKVRIRRVM